jgi:phage-related protein
MTDIIAQNAAFVATILAPFLPYLIEAGKGMAKTIGEEVSKESFNNAQNAWEKIKTHFKGDPKIADSTAGLAANPADQDYLHLLAKALAARMAEKPELAEELVETLGGHKAVQKVLADKSSWVEEIIQEIKENGTQTLEAKNDSVIKNVKQHIG